MKRINEYIVSWPMKRDQWLYSNFMGAPIHTKFGQWRDINFHWSILCMKYMHKIGQWHSMISGQYVIPTVTTSSTTTTKMSTRSLLWWFQKMTFLAIFWSWCGWWWMMMDDMMKDDDGWWRMMMDVMNDDGWWCMMMDDDAIEVLFIACKLRGSCRWCIIFYVYWFI